MDGFTEVTDPELLQQLDGGGNAPAPQPTAPSRLKPVEDPELLRQLDTPDALGEVVGNAGRRAGLRITGAVDTGLAESYKQRAEDVDRSFGEIVTDAYGIPEGQSFMGPDGRINAQPGITPLLEGAYRYGMSRLNSLAGETKESLTGKAAENFEAARRAREQAGNTLRSEPAQRYEQAIQGGKNILEVGWNDPAALAAMVGETAIESAPSMAAAIGAGAITRSPAVGAAVMGATSGLQERYGSVLDFLSENGVDLTSPEQTKKALFNPDLMAKAQQYGLTRGMIIGALDGLSGVVAGKALSSGILKNFAAQMGLQAGLGGAGEGLAQGATKGWDKIDWNDVGLEALAEFATAPIEVVGVGQQYLRSKNKPTSGINVEEVLNDVAAGTPGARETLVGYGIPDDEIDGMVQRRTGATAETAPAAESTVDVASEKGPDQAQADAITATQTGAPANETPRERVLRMARERDQRAAAQPAATPPAAPPATPPVTPTSNQQAGAPTAVAGEPPTAVGAESAAPPPPAPAAATPNDEITANVPEAPAEAATEEVTPEVTVPEKQDTLNIQRAELVDPDSERIVVQYPKGTKMKLYPKPKEARIERYPSGKYGTFDFDASKITRAEISAAAKNNRLNELLGLGPFNKQEVAESASAGATPVAVTERTPGGTEVKAAAGTTETAPVQQQALEETKAAPENTVQVEDPRTVIEDRLEPAPVRRTVTQGYEGPNPDLVQNRIAYLEQLAADESKSDATRREARTRAVDFKNYAEIRDKLFEDNNTPEATRAQVRALAPDDVITGQTRKGETLTGRIEGWNSRGTIGVVDADGFNHDILPHTVTDAEMVGGAQAPAPKAAPKAEAAKEVSKAREEKKEAAPSNTASVAFMMTKAMRAELAKRGYTAEQIKNMKPAEAQEILKSEPKNAATQEAPAPKAEEAKATSKAREEKAEAAPPKPRVLEDQSIESKKAKQEQAEQNEIIADQIKPFLKGRGKEKTLKDAEEKTGKNWTPAERAARRKLNEDSEKLVKEYAPTPEINRAERDFMDEDATKRKNARAAIRARAEAMLAAADEADIKLPEKVYGNTDKSMDLGAGAMNLVVARDFLDALKSPYKPAEEHYIDFLSRDMRLRRGLLDEVVSERRTEIDDKVRKGQGGNIEQISANRVGDTSAEADTELSADTQDAADAKIVGKDDVETKVSRSAKMAPRLDDGTQKGELTIKTEDGKTKKVVEDVAKPASAGRVLSKEEKEAWARAAGILKRSSGQSSDKPVRDVRDDEVLQPGLTLSKAFDRAGLPRGNWFNQSFSLRLTKLLREKAGDVPVLVVEQQTLDEMFPTKAGRVDGYYDPQKDHIVVSARLLKNGKFDRSILAHEAVHAYLQRALESNPNLKADVEQIMDYVRSLAPSDLKDAYGFKDAHEFISEALTNDKFQNLLARIRVSPELASKFDMPENGSVWEALVQLVRKFMGFSDKDIDALSYTLRLTERIAAEEARTGERSLLSGMRQRGMLRERDYAAELMDAGVPEDVAREIHDTITSELGKSIDPSTLPLLMADIVAEYARPATSQSNASNPPPPTPPITSGAAPASAAAPSPYVAASGSKFRRFALKVTTLDYIRQAYDKAFGGLLDPYVKVIQRYEKIVADTSEPHDKDAADFLDLLRTDPEEGRNMANLAMEATRLNVRLGPGANNDHLGKSTKNHQGRTRLAGLNARFDQLKPPTRALYKRMTENYRQTHNENVRALAYNLLTTLDLKTRLSNSDLMMLLDKTVNGTLTKADAAVIGEPKIYKELKRATTLRTIQGDYFPQMRFGDFVVLTKDKIADPGITFVTSKGNKRIPVKSAVKDNVVSFQIDPMIRGARSALNRTVANYIGQSDLTLLRATKTYVERKTGKATKPGDMDITKDYDLVWNLEFQTRGVNFFESEVEANKFRSDVQALSGSQLAELSPVLDRRKDGEQYEKIISGSALTEVTKRINARKDLKPWQRKQMEAAVREAIISQMTGNRAQKRHMARRNVKGASTDVARAAVTYGQSAGNYYAMLTTSNEMRESFNALEEYNTANQTKAGGDVRSMVMNELRARQETLADPLYVNKLMQQVATISFLDKLFSPAHSIINFVQVVGNTVPYLGGKYGNAATAAAVGRAYAKMGVGETVLGGVKNTAKAVKDWQRSWLDTTDLVGSIKKKLGPEYEALIDELVERGILEPNSGFEIGAAVSGGEGVVGSTLAKLDRAARQLPASIEVVNRVVAAVATYDLVISESKSKNLPAGKAKQDAIQEAYNVISMTQGDYRKSNNPRFMRDPRLSWAMQFKKYAVMQSQLIGDIYVRALKGATPQERRIALKQLANLLTTQVMIAGAVGLPGLELIKVALLLTSVFTGFGWDDLEEELKEVLDESVGETASELLRKGVISRAIGVDVSTRMSQADLWTGFTPETLDKDTIPKYVGSLLLGAPGGLAGDWVAAGLSLQDGDVAKFVEKAVPIKFAADTIAAAQAVQSGKMTPVEAAVKSIGFQPSRIANINEEIGREIRDNKEISDERNSLYKQYLNAATPGQIARVTAKIREFNARMGKDGRKLSLKSLEKRRRREMERYQ